MGLVWKWQQLTCRICIPHGNNLLLLNVEDVIDFDLEVNWISAGKNAQWKTDNQTWKCQQNKEWFKELQTHIITVSILS